MYYKKKEEYSFSMPREHKAYLAFKERLKEIGVKYIEEGGNTTAAISVVTRGNFDVDDKCDILELIKEDK